MRQTKERITSLLISLLLLAAMLPMSVWADDAEAGAIAVQVMAADYNSESNTFTRRKGPLRVTVSGEAPTVADVLEAGKEELPYTMVTGEYGAFVDSIDGVTLAEQEGWLFTVNDAVSMTGVSETAVQDGDKVLWYPGTPANEYTGPTWESLAETGEMPENPENPDVPDVPGDPSLSDWPLWRGSADNMAVTTAETARGAEEAVLLWQTKMTSGWTLSTPVIAGGYLYLATDEGLNRVDPVTGQIVKTVTLAGKMNFTPHLAYGGGKLFVPLAGGAVQAFDAQSMESLWVSEKTGNADQALSPLLYADGYLYGGTMGATGAYYCLNTADENTETPDETKLPVWKHGSEARGYYWAGAAISGDAILFGGEDGMLTSLNKTSGEPIDVLEADGAIRSSIALAYGKAVFTTKAGSVYSVPVNADGTFAHDTVLHNKIAENAAESSSTPVVTGGRIYAGAMTAEKKGIFAALDGYTLEPVYSTELPANVQSSALASTAYAADAQKTYLYFTNNSRPGGIQVAEDFAGNMEPAVYDLFLPEDDAQNFCIASVIADDNGTLYYKNDSGYLFAVGKRALTGAPVTVSVVPANAEITVTDADGAEVTPVSPANYDLPAGRYTYRAALSGYGAKSGSIEVTEAQAAAHTPQTIRLSLVKDVSGGGSGNIRVTFSLQGDTVHGTDAHTKSPVWIDKTTVNVAAGASAFDVFNQILTDKGFSYSEKTYNYIESITTPASLGSITLAELDNGPLSGWMYSVNNDYPLLGMREQSLKNGDKILFYYTDDFTQEPPSIEWNESKKDKTSGGSGNRKNGNITALPPEAAAGGEQAATFTDVPETHWARSYITDLAARGIMKGDGAGAFLPDRSVTRAEFAALLARLSGEALEKKESSFADVAETDWFASEVVWAAEHGIVNGYEDGSFRPQEQITRQDIAVMLYRYALACSVTLPQAAEPAELADREQIAGYAAEAVAALQRAGIIGGRDNGTYAPLESATRADAAKLLSMVDALAK